MTVPLLLMKFLFATNLSFAAMCCLTWSSGAGSALRIANGDNGMLVATGDLNPASRPGPAWISMQALNSGLPTTTTAFSW